ncbi:MAG: hypothetical protein Q9217_003187 [Psora testacea]
MTSFSILKAINGRFRAVDNNVPSLAATKQKSGTNYIFYYVEDHKIAFLTGGDVSTYSEKTLKVKDSSENYNDVVGSNSPLAASTWNDEIRLYYIDYDKYLKELCLDSQGNWFYGALTDKKYKTSGHSGLYAAGNADHQKDGGNITVLFMDANDSDNLTQATIDTTTRKWKTVVIST